MNRGKHTARRGAAESQCLTTWPPIAGRGMHGSALRPTALLASPQPALACSPREARQKPGVGPPAKFGRSVAVRWAHARGLPPSSRARAPERNRRAVCLASHASELPTVAAATGTSRAARAVGQVTSARALASPITCPPPAAMGPLARSRWEGCPERITSSQLSQMISNFVFCAKTEVREG